MTTSAISRMGRSPEEGIKAPVKTSTTTNITLFGTGQTLNGVVTATKDRVLVKDQIVPGQNGIYTVGPDLWQRTTDMNAADDLANGQLVVDSNTSVVYSITFTGAWDPDATPVYFNVLVGAMPAAIVLTSNATIDLVDHDVALNVGALDPSISQHLEMDHSGIQSKSDDTTAAVLNLNRLGGDVVVGGNILSPDDASLLWISSGDTTSVGAAIYLLGGTGVGPSNGDTRFYSNGNQWASWDESSGAFGVNVGSGGGKTWMLRVNTAGVQLNDTLDITGASGQAIVVNSGLSTFQEVDIFHTTVAADEHALEIITDAAGFGDVKALEIQYETGAINTGTDEAVMLININETAAIGGDVIALAVLATDGSADEIWAMGVGAAVGPIKQQSGVFVAPTLWDNNGVDETTEISGAGTSSVFVADNDYVIVTFTSQFSEIGVALTIAASGGGIAPTFEFSTGGSSFQAFTPIDGTDGFKFTGIIDWDVADVPGWVTNTSGNFEIRITRTRNTLSTTPVVDTAVVVDAATFFWDKLGNVQVNDLTLNGDIHLDTNRLYLDADNDTYIYSGSDDQMTFICGNGSQLWLQSALAAFYAPQIRFGDGNENDQLLRFYTTSNVAATQEIRFDAQSVTKAFFKFDDNIDSLTISTVEDLILGAGDATAVTIDTNQDAIFAGAVDVQGAFNSIGIDDNATLSTRLTINNAGIELASTSLQCNILKNTDSGVLTVGGGTDINSGAAITFNGETHSNAFDWEITAGLFHDYVIKWDNSVGDMEFQTGSASTKVSALTLNSDQTATFAKKVIFDASTTADPSCNIPHGAAPTAPADGDMWTTTAGLYVRINGSTIGPLS